jgi:predicted CXXCH cytochrome family protein
MQVASDETVLGDFEDARFAHFPVVTRFFRKDEEFYVNTEGPDGRTADFRVPYVFGVEPLQQILVELPGGRLQALGIAWDTQRGQWFDLYPDERFEPGDPLHWTGRLQRWNTMCAECHSTQLRRGYDVEGGVYQTSWAEIDVGCQACHGPGEAHVRWAEALAGAAAPEAADDGLVVHFDAADARGEIETCAPCHSRRHRIRSEERPGRPLLDGYVPATLREGLYHADGQIDGEVYVYGSFAQSRMYQRGVRCTDCHDPHDLTLREEGNALCTRCHQQQPDPRFPTLARKTYDGPAHHFHPAGSEAARCVACHMPARTYMEVDPRRDHSFRVPRPDLSVTLGTPNACTGCHADRSPQWAADAVADWYGPERQRSPHYGEAIAAGRRGAPEAGRALVALAGDAEQPAIVRATALELLPGYGRAALEAALAATRDDDPLLRATAVAGLEAVPPQLRLALAAPLLEDPVRAVRIQAARVLASLPASEFEPTQRRALGAALAEYRDAQSAQPDTPEAHLNLAVIEADRGRGEQAEQSYRTAIRLDPDFFPARANLAMLYNAMGRNEEAERELREAVARSPGQAELHYSLGLLLAEEHRFEEAAASLARAAEQMPGRARVHYNLALALQQLGRGPEGEAALRKARRLEPLDAGIVQALAILYFQQGRWEEALLHARALIELVPDSTQARQLLRQIEAKLESQQRARGAQIVP